MCTFLPGFSSSSDSTAAGQHTRRQSRLLVQDEGIASSLHTHLNMFLETPWAPSQRRGQLTVHCLLRELDNLSSCTLHMPKLDLWLTQVFLCVPHKAEKGTLEFLPKPFPCLSKYKHHSLYCLGQTLRSDYGILLYCSKYDHMAPSISPLWWAGRLKTPSPRYPSI